VPLALADLDHHAGAVDVLDAEPGDLGEPQPTGIRGHEQRAVLAVLKRVEEAGHLVNAEHYRELLGRLGAGDLFDDPLPAQCDAVKEPKGKAGLLVDVTGDLPLLDQVEEVEANVLGPELVGRGVDVPGEIGDPVDVEADRLGGQVVEDQRSSVMRRRSGVMASSFLEGARTESPSAASIIERRIRPWTRPVGLRAPRDREQGCKRKGFGGDHGPRRDHGL
jgi:hypothetical protein